MRIEEYLNTVTEQMRCKKAREGVAEELRTHILCQAQEYEKFGLSEETALEKAVQGMGDPVETGVSMDRIHRPQMAWDILILIGIISILSIVFQAVLGNYGGKTGEGNEYLRNHIIYTVFGYVLMLAVHRLDYSFIGKHSKVIAAGALFLIIGITILWGKEINGMQIMAVGPVSISISVYMYLYIPLFGAVLYQYRGEGYGILWKAALWSAVPVLFAFRMPDISTAILLGISFAAVFSVAVWKGWYHINRRRVLLGLWAGILLLPVPCFGILQMAGRVAAYQSARIQAFLNLDASDDYVINIIRTVLEESSFFGRNKEGLEFITVKLPELHSDNIFVGIVAAYGIFAGILIVALLAGVVIKIFRVSFRQKNQLGMIMACSSGLVFGLQIVGNIMVNMGLFPRTATLLPFFSSGGSAILVSYILLGLTLSVYRYKNILSEKRTSGYTEKSAC